MRDFAALTSERRRWRPTDVPGCVALFDPARGVTLNGTTVAAIADQSSRGLGLTQGTASSQPTWSATGGPDGGPCLVFDGGDFLAGATAGDWKFLHVAAGHHVFCLWRTDSTATGVQGLWSTHNSGGPVGSCVFWDKRTSPAWQQRVSFASANGSAYVLNGTSSADGAAPANTWGVTDARFAYADPGNDFEVRQNGTLIASAAGTGAVPAAGDPQVALRLGTVHAWTPLTGKIRYWVAYDRPLSTADALRVRRYLGTLGRVAVT